jgi:Mg/Co/Ni transporter MgtE
MVDSLEAEGKNYLAQIDSLKEKNKQAKQHNEKLVTKMPEKVTKKSIGEDVSKSLLNLDQEALSPIVNLLDDEQLVGLYNSASNMQRAKLLRSLKPEKAATVLKKVM